MEDYFIDPNEIELYKTGFKRNRVVRKVKEYALIVTLGALSIIVIGLIIIGFNEVMHGK